MYLYNLYRDTRAAVLLGRVFTHTNGLLQNMFFLSQRLPKMSQIDVFLLCSSQCHRFNFKPRSHSACNRTVVGERDIGFNCNPVFGLIWPIIDERRVLDLVEWFKMSEALVVCLGALSSRVGWWCPPLWRWKKRRRVWSNCEVLQLSSLSG